MSPVCKAARVPVEESERKERYPAKRPSGRSLIADAPRRAHVPTESGARLRVFVLASNADDTTGVDLGSGSVVRLRPPHDRESGARFGRFQVIEATLAGDPERDDLAQPEALTVASTPIVIGQLRGRRVHRILERLSDPALGPLLGFLGPAAPYWEFTGRRPSVAVINPPRGLQLIYRRVDHSTWVRFGWHRDDVWLPVEDAEVRESMANADRPRIAGKALSPVLGFMPRYLLAVVSRPRNGHCYKVCSAVLPGR